MIPILPAGTRKAFFALALITSVLAPPPLAKAASPDATVTFETSSIAAGVGVTWGDGKLSYRGREQRFTINGVSLIDVGISSASAIGDVFNLERISDFEGTYAAATGSVAVGAGMGGLTMRNQNSVIVNLRSTEAGLKLALGPQGVKIELK